MEKEAISNHSIRHRGTCTSIFPPMLVLGPCNPNRHIVLALINCSTTTTLIDPPPAPFYPLCLVLRILRGVRTFLPLHVGATPSRTSPLLLRPWRATSCIIALQPLFKALA